MIKIVHIMKDEYDVYIGRPGPFGNPYTHKNNTQAKYKVATREEAVEKYREYLLSNKDLLEKIRELKDKTLGCWCAKKGGITINDKPFVCHGQVIAEILENLDE